MSLVFRHGTSPVSIYARGEYLVVRTVKRHCSVCVSACVWVYARACVYVCARVSKVSSEFERNEKTARKRDHGRGRDLFKRADGNSETFRSRRCRRNSRGKRVALETIRERKKKKEKKEREGWEETHLAGVQLDWPFVRDSDADRPWGHSAGFCSDTTGKIEKWNVIL